MKVLRNAWGDYCWFCDFGYGRRVVQVAGGLICLGLWFGLLWGVVCALTEADIVGVLLLPAAALAWRRVVAPA